MERAEWLRSELTAFACSSCGGAFGADDIRVLAQREDLFFAALACGVCAVEEIAVVTLEHAEGVTLIQAGELARSGEAGDGAARTTGRASPIEASEVLAMRAFLRRFEGDFRSLFADDDRGEGRGGDDGPERFAPRP